MTVCFFGNSFPDYPRMLALKKGLAANGVKILECHTRQTGPAKYFHLWQQHRKFRNQYDVLLVTMGAYSLVPFARFLTREKLIFDAFVSLVITAQDRGQGGGLAKFWDRYACKIADRVLLDTDAQIDYFVENYKLPREKFIRVLAGADDSIFFPNPTSYIPHSKFIVHWHGHIVPFHGLGTIIEAAKILQNNPAIQFQIVTRFNSKFEKIRTQAEALGLRNIQFYPETSYQGLAEMINKANICLGVFGENLKAQVVIPNKIFEAIACRKPVVTADTPALRELFNEDSITFCRAGSAAGLAEAILDLYNNQVAAQKLAQRAHSIYLAKLTPRKIGEHLVGILQHL